MVYKSYQHVNKLGTSDVEGILQGDVYLFYKIDGTNACIWLKDDGTIGFGSRRQELSIVDDNRGFMTSITSNKALLNNITTLLTNHPSYILYGEWLVPHTLKSYQKNAWKTFYLFDILDTTTNKYIDYETYSNMLDKQYSEITYIPLIAKLTNPTEEQLEEYLNKTGDWLVENTLGEGIVVKNYNFINRYGRISWAKLLTEDYKKEKNTTRVENHLQKETSPVEYAIIKLLTIEHVLKEKSKLEEIYGGWSSNNIFELLNRTFNEFWKDNWEIILKKFHSPTINFKILKTLSDNFVKKVLNI